VFRRVRGLIAHGNQAINNTEALVKALADDVTDLIKDLHDKGLTLELVSTEDGTLFDFAMGKIKTLPVQIRVKIAEDSLDKQATP
jgi:hypothetical protein